MTIALVVISKVTRVINNDIKDNHFAFALLFGSLVGLGGGFGPSSSLSLIVDDLLSIPPARILPIPPCLTPYAANLNALG